MPPRHRSRSLRFAEHIARPVLAVISKRNWRGAEHLPQTEGFVAVGNHISHLDPFPMGLFLNDNGCPPRFLAKDAVMNFPLTGRLLRNAGQICVVRESGDMAGSLGRAVEAVREGECVALYPEGTLTRDPNQWPMSGKTGVARIALTTGCPVIPVAQWGTQYILPAYAKWPRLFPRRTVYVWAGPPVDLSAFQGKPLDTATLRAASEAITDALTEVLSQIRNEPVPPARWNPRTDRLPKYGNPKRARQQQRAQQQAQQAQDRSQTQNRSQGQAAS